MDQTIDRPPLPPFNAETAAQKARMAEDAWNTRDPASHETAALEFPVLVSVRAKPLAAVVVPLVGEAYRDAVVAKRPDFLDQPVVELAAPLARQKRLDRRTAR